MSIDKDLGALLNERSAGSGRRLRWAAAATLIAVGVLLVYFAFFDGDSGSTLPPQSAVVTRGQLVSTLDTSGTFDSQFCFEYQPPAKSRMIAADCRAWRSMALATSIRSEIDPSTWFESSRSK